jgi:cholesterol transport system auxiliary component
VAARSRQTARLLTMNPMRLALCLGASGASCALAALVTACSMLLPARAPDVYRLPQPQHAEHPLTARPSQQDAPGRTAIVASATDPVLLRIRTEALSSVLAGEKIIVMPGPDTVEAYRDARWSDPAPAMVRAELIDVFANDGRFIAVARDDGALDVKFELDTQLRAFQTEYREGRPVVHVALDARLIDSGMHRVIGTQRFDVETVPATADIGGVVQSFGAATNTLSAQLVEWLASVVQPHG